MPNYCITAPGPSASHTPKALAVEHHAPSGALRQVAGLLSTRPWNAGGVLRMQVTLASMISTSISALEKIELTTGDRNRP